MSVNVGESQEYVWLGRALRSSIFKHPVDGPVAARGVNLAGDSQSARSEHGGPDKAVYAYALEDLAWWEGELGRPLEPGVFGENLTTAGIDCTHAVIGERWRVGTVLLEVSEPRTPCWKLGLRFDDPAFPRRFAKARRAGVLLRIVEEGVLQAGDVVAVVDRPDHGVTTDTINRIYYGDNRDISPILTTPQLADHWRARWLGVRRQFHDDLPPLESAG